MKKSEGVGNGRKELMLRDGVHGGGNRVKGSRKGRELERRECKGRNEGELGE